MARDEQEKRQHTRFNVGVSFSLFSKSGKQLVDCRSSNLSDGGTYISVPIEVAGKLNGALNVSFSVPRNTENTFMLEDFAAHAKVIRHEPLEDDHEKAGVALQFEKPLELDLDLYRHFF